MLLYRCLGKCCYVLPQRYIVSTAVLVCFTIMFIQRICFNLAITEMAFRINETVKDDKIEICDGHNRTEEIHTTSRAAEFHWTKNDQAWLLSVFYIGYILAHVPAGILSDKYGPKKVLGYGMLVSGICTLLTPICARVNLYLLLFLRFILGISQGPLFPAQSTFCAHWSMIHERDFINAFMNLGSIVGAVVGQLGTGYLINSLHRWDTVFYIFGWSTVPSYLFWALFAWNSVETHPFIHMKERTTVIRDLEAEVMENVDLQYKKIFLSLPVWAMLIAGFGHDWAYFIILTVLPQYMSYVLLFDVEQNGLFLCLPHLAMAIVSLIAPYVARFLITSQLMTKTTQCKVFFTICNQGAVVCFLAATYSGCNRVVVVALFTIAMGLLGMIYSCVRVVQVDLAPNAAGFLMAIMNGSGALSGFFVPTLFALVQTSNTVAGWRNAFFFSSVMITTTTVVFLVFGTTDVQDWNFPRRSGENAAGQEEEEEGDPGKKGLGEKLGT